ncbi:MAG: murein biosynthesis integral membrane protein MurJ [Methylotenera sp.]|nr:murein biosynthesis integral membrane protein MurJ [Oligoflexia bacterium]
MTDIPKKTRTGIAALTGANLVAAGILLSRVAGLIRERVFAHYFGNSDAGDAFKAALKIPNFLQNLFGEGVLSASFIPVYAGLVSRGEKDEAGKVAGAIASLLALMVSLLVLAGVLATPILIDLIAPGFHGEKRDLTIRLVQIFFPGTGLLVMSAWCLGILNSHRKFFLSYAAPVLWNFAIIVALVSFGGHSSQTHLAVVAAWGLVIGSVLQFGTQLPVALRLISNFRPNLSVQLQSVRTVIRNFLPVVVSRGVVQVSAYIDSMIASFLPSGAVSALAYAQVIYLLPISLFGMSISAAELPQMSSATGTDEEIAAFLRTRLNSALRKIAFFVVPSVVAFAVLGDVIISAIYQSGAFTRDNTVYVWGVLAGSTIGLLSATLGRIYSSGFYALKDTRTPLRFAVVRVVFTIVLGLIFALVLPKALGLDSSWGTAGLTASAGIAAWIEFLLLRREMTRRTGHSGIPVDFQVKLWSAAIGASAVAFALKFAVQGVHPVLAAVIVLGPYGVIYFGVTSALGISEAQKITSKLTRRLRR